MNTEKHGYSFVSSSLRIFVNETVSSFSAEETQMLKYLLSLLFLCVLAASAAAQNPNLVVYQGDKGPGQGKHIVFLAGDHEYRSEESLPALARLLAKHHGFQCTVLFNIDPASGEIVAGNSNMPGMEALDSADLAVVFLRFQA